MYTCVTSFYQMLKYHLFGCRLGIEKFLQFNLIQNTMSAVYRNFFLSTSRLAVVALLVIRSQIHFSHAGITKMVNAGFQSIFYLQHETICFRQNCNSLPQHNPWHSWKKQLPFTNRYHGGREAASTLAPRLTKKI